MSSQTTYYLCGQSVCETPPLEEEHDARPLPPMLVIPPGTYSLHDHVYRLEREGLYRFIRMGEENLQRLVYRNDIAALISSLCWIHSHGFRNDKQTFEELAIFAQTDKLIMTCGPYSEFANTLLAQQGIRSRLVGGCVMKPENAGDDGHRLLEVRLNGAWVLFDVDGHAAFRHQGRRLNLFDAVRQIQRDDYELESLSSSTRMAIGSYRKNGYDYGMVDETRMFSDRALRRWYGRVMRLPLIFEGSVATMTCADRDRAELAKSWPRLPWPWIGEADFDARFYSETTP